MEPNLQTPQPLYRVHNELDESPLVWKLLKYEGEFIKQSTTVESIGQIISTRIGVCATCIQEYEKQTYGIDSSVQELKEHLGRLMSTYTSFAQYYTALDERHRKLLQSFENDMQKLRETKLHTSLVTGNMETLMDYVPEAKLRAWAQECSKEHEQLALKVMELEKTVAAERENSQSYVVPADFELKPLQTQLQRARDILSDVQLRSQIFIEDVKKVQQKITEARQKENPKLLWEFCDALEDVQSSHERQLELVNKHADTMKNIVNYVTSTKSRTGLSSSTRSLGMTQSIQKIKDLNNKIVVYLEALNRQKTAFHQLLYVHQMPKAYYAGLEEVARRRKFGKKLSNSMKKISSFLVDMRKEEYDKRKRFMETYGRYIPRDLIPGLMDNLPPFDFQLPQFDSQLPSIESQTSPRTSMESEFAMILSEDNSGKIQELEAENQRLIGELRTFKSEIHSSRGSDKESVDLYKLKSELLHSQESASDYRKRIEQLESKLSITYSQVEKAETMVRHYQDKYEQTERMLDDLKESHFDELEDDRLQSDHQIQNLREQLGNLQLEIKLKVEEAEKLSAELDDLRGELKRVQVENQEKQIQLEELSTRVVENEKNLGNFQREDQEKSENLENLKIQLENVNLSLKSVETKFKSVQLENQDLLEHQAEDRGRIVQLETEIFNLKSQLENKELAISQIESNRNELVQLETSAQLEISKLKEISKEKRNLEIQLADTSDTVFKLKAQVEKLNQQVAGLTEENSKISKSKSQLEVQLENQLEKSRETESVSQEKISQLENQLEEMSNKLKHQASEFEEHDSEQREIYSKLQVESKIQVENSKKSLEELNVQLEKTRRELAEKSQEVSRLQDSIDSEAKLQAAKIREIQVEFQVEREKQNSELNSLKSEFEQKKNSWKSQQDNLEASFQVEIENWKKKERIQDESVRTLTRDLEISRRNLAENSELSASQIDVKNSLESTISNLRVQLEQSEERSRKLKPEIENLNSELESLRKFKENSSAETSRLEKDNADLNKQIVLLRSQPISDDEAKSAERERELQKISQSLTAMTKKYLDAVKLIENSNKNMNQLKARNEALEKRPQDSQKEISAEFQRYKDEVKSLSAIIPFEKKSQSDQVDFEELKSRIRQLKELWSKADLKEKSSLDLIKAMELGQKASQQEAERKIQNLASQITALELEMTGKACISLENFRAGDFILFTCNSAGHYEAYNRGFPRYYLHQHQVGDTFKDEAKWKGLIFGQIVEIERHVSSKDYNPFKLNLQVEFHQVLLQKHSSEPNL